MFRRGLGSQSPANVGPFFIIWALGGQNNSGQMAMIFNWERLKADWRPEIHATMPRTSQEGCARILGAKLLPGSRLLVLKYPVRG